MQSIPSSDPSQPRSFGGGEAVELTVYYDALRPGVASSFYDTLESEYADRGLRISHRFTAAESFGRSRRVRHDTSPELDPPMVMVAVDAFPTINSALGSISSSVGDLLVTLARTEIVPRTAHALQTLGSEPAELAIHCRRGSSREDPHGVGGVLEQLRRLGIAGATALGHGEGTIAGQRHRPRMLSPSPDGPMMVVSIDQADVLTRATPSLLAMPQVELITIKPTFLCKWRGRREPPPVPTADQPAWSRITLYAAGAGMFGWRPEHLKLVGRPRKLGAPGVTVLRAALGYALDDPLRPAQGWSMKRTAPMVTTILDTPDHAAQWLRAIDEVTDDDGLVTHEFVWAPRLM